MVCMKQLNVNVTPEFERDLRQFMRQRQLSRKTDAIRLAMREAVSRGKGSEEEDFRAWLGLGLKVPLRKNPRFRSEDELWS